MCGLPFISLDSVTSIGAGDALDSQNVLTYHGMIVTVDNGGSATIALQISNDGINWASFGQASGIEDETVSVNGSSSPMPARYVRANVTSISGSPTITASVASS